MLLQPRSFKYKRKLKRRSFTNFKNKNFLNYGFAGLLILTPVTLTGQKIFRFKLFLKRAMKKPDKTYRYVWFNSFPHMPLTKKTVGSRMGKGKGKLHKWSTRISGGTCLFEFKNLRPGRASFFVKQVNLKLKFTSIMFTRPKYFFNQPLNSNKKIVFRNFW